MSPQEGGKLGCVSTRSAGRYLRLPQLPSSRLDFLQLLITFII